MGNRLKFNSLGHCHVFTSSSDDAQEYLFSRTEELISSVTNLAALVHDLGKFTVWFQRKLRKAASSQEIIVDPIRHEVISLAVVRAMFHLSGNNDDDFLDKLSTPNETRALIAKAYDSVRASPGFFITGNEEYLRSPEKFIRSLSRQSDGIEIQIPFGKETSWKFAMLCSLVLTHHRLPDAIAPNREGKPLKVILKGKSQMFSDRFASDDKLSVLIQENVSIPAGVPLWEDDLWVADLNKSARALRSKVVTDGPIEFRLLNIFGRTALIIGDHKASEIGNTEFPCEGQEYSSDLAYANTSKLVPGSLAEPLSSHLRRVYREARQAFMLFSAGKRQFPALLHDDLPESIRRPRNASDSPFRWQSEARKVTRNVMKTAGAGAGFFGVLMSETGSGKTRAAPIIMAAANMHETVRFSLVSGLRSLTLQSGIEYVEDLKVPASSVSVVIGDELTRNLHELSTTKAVGTSADAYDDLMSWSPGEFREPLPTLAQRLFENEGKSAHLELLSKPVAVATIDMLMSAADAKRGSHTVAMMRLATADLIIDEIDNFGDEDIVAIARLVYTAASFGRKVLIASATVGEPVMMALVRAYLSGWENHKQMSGTDTSVVCGLFSNRTDSVAFECAAAPAFEEQARTFVTAYIKEIVARPAKRIAARLAFDGYRPDQVFTSVTNAAIRLHHDFKIIDPVSGKHLSVGVVRWNNVRPSFQYAYHLSEYESDDLCVKMVPYNGTLLPVMRHELERQINPMLKRRLINGQDPIFDHPVVRQCLDASDHADVMIVVVTTSLEETGRDHDFDWCITEPGTMRGLVQMAGRVLRHRDHTVDKPNMLIMEKPFRWIEREQGNSLVMPLSLPGIETPMAGIKGNVEVKSLGIEFPSYDAADLFDFRQLRSGVTAADLITFAEPSHPLSRMERKRTQELLAGHIETNDHCSVTDFLSDPFQGLTNYHPNHRRFRRNSDIEVGYYFDTEATSYGWRAMVSRKQYNVGVATKVREIEISNRNLLLRFDDIEAMQASIVHQLSPNGSLARWKRDALLTISRPLHSEDDIKRVEYLYNQNLGFLERKPWLTYMAG